jgi:hypothetical protein
VIEEILQERVRPRSNRRNKRGVKRKMSSYPMRRKSDPTMPACVIATAIKILK